MKLLPLVKDEVVDTIFADPPFNIGKEYGKNTEIACRMSTTFSGAGNGLQNACGCLNLAAHCFCPFPNGTCCLGLFFMNRDLSSGTG